MDEKLIECRLFASVPIAIDKVTKSSTQLLPEESSAIPSNLSIIQNANASNVNTEKPSPSNSQPNRSVSFFHSSKNKTKSTSNINNISHSNIKAKTPDTDKPLHSAESSLSINHKDEDVIDEQIKSEMQEGEATLPVKWNQLGKFTKTSIIFKNLNPKWGEAGEDLIMFIEKDIFEQVLSQRHNVNRTKLFLRLDAFDYDKYTRDDVLGHCIIDLEAEDIYSLLNTPSPKSITKPLIGVKHGSINFDISLMEDPAIFNAELAHILQRRREKGNLLPKSIDILFDYVLENCCEIEGVLRIPGNRAHILRLKKKMDEMIILPVGTFIEEFVPEETTVEFLHTAVGVLKEYLRVMPTPIIQYELYDDCISLIETKSLNLEKLESVLRRVERAHIPLFHKTMQFMKKIADKSSINRMTPKNIGIVMGPNILRRRNQTADSALRHVNHITGFVEFLINSHDHIMKVLDQIMFEGMDQAGKFETLMNALEIVTVEEEEDVHSENTDQDQSTILAELTINESSSNPNLNQEDAISILSEKQLTSPPTPIDHAVIPSTSNTSLTNSSQQDNQQEQPTIVE